MSRIGKKTIEIPESIRFNVVGNKISVIGEKGALEKNFLEVIKFRQASNKLFISRAEETKFSRSYHGLSKVLIENMIHGVTKGFQKTLVAEGIGYKFQIGESCLILSVGFSHTVKILIPSDITLKLESPVKLKIEGTDKERIGFFAAKIRDVKPPEPYKGKGILFEGEKIIRKAGKTGK